MGGVLGREVKLVIEDEGDNQQTAINASQKVLSNENLSGFIGGFTSSYGLAMIPFVNNAEVPFMALGTSASIAAEKSEWTWQTRLIDSYSSTALADAAAGLLKFEKPAILYVNESFGISSYESVVKELKEKYNVTPSISLAYNRGESQFSNMFTQILASDADGLIAFVTQPIDAATIMSQTKAMNFSIPKLGSSGFAMAVARQAVKGDADGWYVVTDYSSDGTHAACIDFEKAYQERWGTAGDLGAVTAYDSIMLLAKAAEQAGSSEPAKINAELAKIEDYKGALSDMTTDMNCQCFAQWEVLVMNENEGQTCSVIDYIMK